MNPMPPNKITPQRGPKRLDRPQGPTILGGGGAGRWGDLRAPDGAIRIGSRPVMS